MAKKWPEAEIVRREAICGDHKGPAASCNSVLVQAARGGGGDTNAPSRRTRWTLDTGYWKKAGGTGCRVNGPAAPAPEGREDQMRRGAAAPAPEGQGNQMRGGPADPAPVPEGGRCPNWLPPFSFAVQMANTTHRRLAIYPHCCFHYSVCLRLRHVLFVHYSHTIHRRLPLSFTLVFVATAARYSARLANLRCNLVHVSTPYSRFPQPSRRLLIAGVWQQAALLCSAVIPTQSTLLLQVCRGGEFYNGKRPLSQRGVPRHPAPACSCFGFASPRTRIRKPA